MKKLLLSLLAMLGVATIAVAETETQWTDLNITVTESLTEVSWTTLEGYTSIKFEITYNTEVEGYNSWAGGAVYFGSAEESKTLNSGTESWDKVRIGYQNNYQSYEWGNTDTEVTYVIATLKTDVDALRTANTLTTPSSGFYVSYWSPATGVKVYGGVEVEGTDPDTYETLEDIDILSEFTNNRVGLATYDDVTKTVTWQTPGNYDDNGAWFGSKEYSGTPSDFSGYYGISVTFTIVVADYFQLVIEYDNDTETSETGLNCVVGKNTLYLAFDPDGITEVTQCYVKCGTISQKVVITEAKVVVNDPSPSPTPTAISNVNVELTEVARYNLMGQKLSGAEKGINIIVYSDGTAKKVLVK